MKNSSFFLLAMLLVTATAQGQETQATLPPGTPLTVQIDRHLPMRIGQPIRAELRYPVYIDESLVLPRGTIVTGTITAFRSDRAKRIRSAFNLDFTPFHIPIVQFTQVKLPSGQTIPIALTPATDGAPLIHLAASPAHKKRNIFHREFDSAVQFTRDSIVFFVGPGRGDRLLQLAYHQLPWHPQRIEKGTAWTAETSQSITLPQTSTPEAPAPSNSPGWTIEATLNEPLSSATAKPGEPIHATVATPVYNPDHTLAIPQGATLVGNITQAKPSRQFGRSGALRFEFHQLILPSGQHQNITVNLAATDSSTTQTLAIDNEGNVKPAPQDKIIVPAILLAFAVAPLDPDPGDNDEFFKNAGASNSLGTAGFIAGIAANSANVSAGFGFYGAALSINDRWIRHGAEVVFPRDSRIVLQTVSHRAEP
jgi:hypothetical protein